MATVYSVQNGDWNTASTWSNGAVPTSADTVQIKHKVTIKADGSASVIEIKEGSLTVAPDWVMTSKATLTCDSIIMDRKLNDSRAVRLEGITLVITAPSITSIGNYSGDGFATTSGAYNTAGTVIIDDPGAMGHTTQMQDIRPEGCARAYARKISNGVRYMTLTVHIKADRCDIIGQLYRMAEGPFQVLATTYSGVIKGYLESIAPMDSVGKEYRSFKITVAEGQSR